jgi:hypothetical protein
MTITRSIGRRLSIQGGKKKINSFKYLSAHMHRMKLNVKYFGKFARFMGILGNNALLSDCTCLCRCIQGHLNYHLS